MKHRFIGTALSLAIAASLMPNAEAATLKYTQQMEDTPKRTVYLSGEEPDKSTGEQTEQNIGFYGVAKLVKENNPTLKVLQKQLTGISHTDVETQLAAQEIGYFTAKDNAAKRISESEEKISEIKEQLAWETDPSKLKNLQNVLAAQQAELMAAQSSMMVAQAGLAGIDDAIESAKESVEDQLYTTRKQSENIANQIAAGAETAYLGIVTMEAQLATLDRQLAALDRNIATVEKQVDIGMGSQITLDNLNQTKRTLLSSRESLLQTKKDTSNQLGLLCGYGTDVILRVSASPTVYHKDLEAMDYIKDLEEAQKNSYSIWVKQNDARTASNDIDDQKVSTLDFFDAAKMAIENEKNSVENSFRTLYEAVLENQRLAEEAKADLKTQEANFKVTAVQYERGMISRNSYLDAKDELEAKKDAVTTAERNLFSAYNTYDWARKGYISTAG